MQALMAATPRPMAVICDNDQTGLGAIIGAQPMGLCVPRDVSITGFKEIGDKEPVRPWNEAGDS